MVVRVFPVKEHFRTRPFQSPSRFGMHLYFPHPHWLSSDCRFRWTPTWEPNQQGNRLKALFLNLRGISLSKYSSEGFRVRLRRLSEYGSVAYLVERPIRETHAQQYSDIVLASVERPSKGWAMNPKMFQKACYITLSSDCQEVSHYLVGLTIHKILIFWVRQSLKGPGRSRNIPYQSLHSLNTSPPFSERHFAPLPFASFTSPSETPLLLFSTSKPLSR